MRYFNIEGPAEKSRLALRLGKIPFEDARVSLDDWRNGDVKATTPYGQLPVLEITDDGTTTRTMAQSDAILRYCGRLATRAGVGLYDDARAEAHNDRGVALQRQKKHDDAFDEFTEAVRLAPSRAVYHANRAAVALKLGRDACAASDALHACERDPNHVAAHVRAATATLRARRDPEESLRLFERALVLDPGNVAAARGKSKTSR